MNDRSHFTVYSVIFFTSFTIISMEILLVRIFSIKEGQSYAPLIISLALLGYGISGVILGYIRNKIEKNLLEFFIAETFLFTLSIPLSFFLYLAVPLNTLEIIWDVKQIFLFLFHFLILVIPFTTGSLILATGFLFKLKSSNIYFFNMAGSASGAILPLILLHFLSPFWALTVIYFTFISIFFLCLLIWEKKRVFSFLLITVFLSLICYWLTEKLNLISYSPYKAISYALNLPEAKILLTKDTPYGKIELVTAKGLRKVNGLSFIFTGDIPQQKLLYIDGNHCGTLLSSKDKKELEYLKWQSCSFPFYFIENQSERKILLINPSGSESILRGIIFGISNITVIEENKYIASLIEREFSNNNSIKIINTEARKFFKTSIDKFDLIDVSLYDSYATSPILSLNENYLYTVESLYEMYNLLSSDGIISLTRWAIYPGIDAIKIFSSIIEMCERYGIPEYWEKILFIRSHNTVTLCLSKTNLPKENIISLTRKLGFDILYHYTLKKEMLNQYFEESEYLNFNTITNILSEKRIPYIKDFPFDIKPTTDNRPYYHNIFKIKTLKDILSRSLQFLPFNEWGSGILIILVTFTLLSGFILILLPSLFLVSKEKATGCIKLLKSFLYFFLIGNAYFFVEIPLIQKLILFLGRPIYSFSIVLFSMLLFSSIGSLISSKIKEKYQKILLSLLPLILLISLFTVNYLNKILLSASMLSKVLITLLLIAPQAFLMGFPFPIMIDRIKKQHPSLIPLMWGINGFASVISSILAALLSILCGFNIVLILSAILYTLATSLVF